MSNEKKLTPVGRVSYPILFEPKVNPLNQKLQYSVDILFDKKTDLSELKKLEEDLIANTWPKEKPNNLRSPFKNGNSKNNPEYEDCIYITFKSNDKPGVVDGSVQSIIDKGEVYGGCYGRVSFSAYSYDNLGNKGINFGLSHFQKIKDGDAFSGRVSVEETFDAVSADNPDSYKKDNSELLDK